MAKKNTRKKEKNINIPFRVNYVIELIKKERTRFISGAALVLVSAYVFLSQFSFLFTGALDQSKIENQSLWTLLKDGVEVTNWGRVLGAYIGELTINKSFGITSFVIPIACIILGLHLMRVIKVRVVRTILLSSFVLILGSLLSASILARIAPDSHIIWGGAHGAYLVDFIEKLLGIPGLVLLLLFFIVLFVVVVKESSIESFQSIFTSKEEEETPYGMDEEEEEEERKSWIKRTWASFIALFSRKQIDEEEEEELEDEDDKIEAIPKEGKSVLEPTFVVEDPKTNENDNGFEVVVPTQDDIVDEPQPKPQPPRTSSVEEDEDNDPNGELEDYDPTLDLSHFAFPSSSLLKVYDTTGREVDMNEQNQNKNKIIETLLNYGIEITSIKATVGPTITLYEIIPKAGVRISKIRNLEDDIALSLAALGIRIIAPIPGKGTIGIEVPNKDPQVVSMQSVIASRKFQESTYDLPVAIGKTITNEVFMFDLAKMPHLLVAGATGQGKSVGLNAIITSLLYKKHPAEMKMVLVDPKMVEFNIYSTIEKHYLAKLPGEEKAIITDVTKVTQTLNSLTREMDDRYELLMQAGVRNIKEYNEKFRKRKLSPTKGHKFLPYIVVIIDEFGDLIMTAGKEIEMPIARIAQKARAVGMHMVIATQRPTTNIITGTIKANFPARMAFRVTSQIDSRTILDTSGANQLIGRGDMLFSQGSDLVRIQCAFVDTPEVQEITNYIGEQQGYASAFDLPEYVGDLSEDKIGGVDLNERDVLFEDAARLIVVHQQGSTSLIQRKFSIGYNRAGRLMDQLEAAGVVGGAQGSKPRDVLIMDEYSLEQMFSMLG